MALALANADTPAVRAVPAPGLEPSEMMQSALWRDAEPVSLEGFRGRDAQATSVRVLVNTKWVFCEFVCGDAAIVSPGMKDGIDHFRLGDTAEVFLAARGSAEYAEIHATPAGRSTVYFCRGYRQPAPAPPAAARVTVCSARDGDGWRAFIAVPRDLLDAVDGEGYDIFFARYDYAADGGAPVLSSFPGQQGEKPDFHRREDYAVLRLHP